MSPLRLNGSTSGYSQLDAPAIAGDQTFTLPGTGGTLDRLNRAGNILQVVNATKTDTTSTTSTSFGDVTGLSASITPTSASNKILIALAVGVCGNTGNFTVVFNFVRGSTNIAQASTGSDPATFRFDNASNSNLGIPANMFWLDSPSTTSSTTYKIQWKVSGGTGTLNNVPGNGNATAVSSLLLLEVAA